MLVNKVSTMILTFAVAMTSVQANSEAIPRSGHLDDRIKTFEYHEDQVYRINAHYFQDTLIMFSVDEQIIRVGAGDPLAWTFNAQDNYLSIKPKLKKADSNLNVLTTNKVTKKIRSYSFSLNAGKASGPGDLKSTFVVKFSYPQKIAQQQMKELAQEYAKEKALAEKEQGLSAERKNTEYYFTGESNMAPIEAFDDGKFTYLKFPKNARIPGIFQVYQDKSEGMLNFHVEHGYIVIQKVVKQLVLRDGLTITCVYNEAFENSDNVRARS